MNLQLAIYPLVLAGLLFIYIYRSLNLQYWIQLRISGVSIGVWTYIKLTSNIINLGKTIRILIRAKFEDLKGITLDGLVRHELSGGDAELVVNSIILARKAKIVLDFDLGCKIDLSKRDLSKMVKELISPLEIDLNELVVSTQNGLILWLDLKISIKPSLNEKRIIGGAGIETVKSNVAQAVFSTIGKSPINFVLSNLEEITDSFFSSQYSEDLLYDILSVSITKADRGINLGLILEADRVYNLFLVDPDVGHAEEKRTLAHAEEQHYHAKYEKSRVELIKSQIKVNSILKNSISENKITPIEYFMIKKMLY